MYVKIMVTTMEKLIVNIQKKMRMESKYYTIENHQNTWEERKREKKKKKGTEKGIPIRLTSDLSAETLQARREWQK